MVVVGKSFGSESCCADLSMSAPIQTKIPPPAQENAANETPKALMIYAPNTDDVISIMAMEITAFTASLVWSFSDKPGTHFENIATHIAGFTKANIVTIACI